MQLLTGFRDFYPEDCAVRNYVLSRWRETARRYGFVEYDGPTLESLELYKKKSGGEILGQLFDFQDKGGDPVALRPEITPTLARMVAAHSRDYPKPMKWFSTPNCFRYERNQRGRKREFLQFNADIVGEASVASDAELIAMAIDLLRDFGFTQNDFLVRISDRNAWAEFAATRGVGEDRFLDFLGVIDKLERDPEAETRRKLEALGIQFEEVQRFIEKPDEEAKALGALRENLNARGFGDYIELDLTIVRGLAYYTGMVFELFDKQKKERALAGGGRYDRLLSLMSDGKVDLPALGFGMGDVVLANLIEDSPAAKARRDDWILKHKAIDIFVVVAKEELRPQAIAQVQRLRDAGFRVDYAMTPAKVGKQFQAAEQAGAQLAVLVGEEWPKLKVKTLATREERLVEADALLGEIAG